MRYVKWSLLAVLVIVVGGFLYWTLPARDVVRILGTEIARQQIEVTNDQGQQVTRSRDVRYIKAVTPDGRARVYRNEDTGWGWPPYFKFDSANLSALADNAASTEASPRWMIVTHYGWRLPLFSRFPNAISIAPATGPDQRLFPWFNLIVLAGLVLLAVLLWRWIAGFFARRKART